MANLKVTTNPLPFLPFTETVDPANPVAGGQRLFVDTDHLLKMIDSSGTVTTFATGGVALSDPMTTRGDIIIRNASNATARLGRGSAGQVLTSDGTDIAWATPASAPVTMPAHGCRVFRDTSDQSLGNNTFTAVQWNNETFDTDTMHDNSTNNTRITIPSISGVTTGLWRFAAKGYTSATALRPDVKIKKNGTTDLDIFVGHTGVSGAWSFEGFWTAVLAATDYMECFVRTTSGTFNLVATDSTALPFFTAEFLGKVS